MNFGVEQSLTTFTSEGALKQCDDALLAALNGGLSVGACSQDGVVLCSIRVAPPLCVKTSITKVACLAPGIGITYSGLQPDFFFIQNEGIKLCEDYFQIYGVYPSAKRVADGLARAMQENTQVAGFRPLGVLLLVAGSTDSKCELIQLDPSGSAQLCEVAACGREYKNAVSFVKSRREGVDDNVGSCVNALQEYAGYTLSPEDVDIGVFRSRTKLFERFTHEMVCEVFASLKLCK